MKLPLCVCVHVKVCRVFFLVFVAVFCVWMVLCNVCACGVCDMSASRHGVRIHWCFKLEFCHAVWILRTRTFCPKPPWNSRSPMPPSSCRYCWHYYRLGCFAYVRNRDGGRSQVLGQKREWPAGHRDPQSAEQPDGCKHGLGGRWDEHISVGW